MSLAIFEVAQEIVKVFRHFRVISNSGVSFFVLRKLTNCVNIFRSYVYPILECNISLKKSLRRTTLKECGLKLARNEFLLVVRSVMLGCHVFA